MSPVSHTSAMPAELPAYDPSSVPESAVIDRLAGNWNRRATVKRAEPDLDELFEISRPDYPERILPFADHSTWTAVPEGARSRVLSWAWIAYNRHTVMAEQRVANPAFALVMDGAFPEISGPTLEAALAQAMVDEQYHTLMHLNASAVTRRHRGQLFSEAVLPVSHTAKVHEQMRKASREDWQKNLTTLAFATVSEISINAYLDLLADDRDIQLMNSSTAKLHNRDEYCHASISDELAKMVYDVLPTNRRRFFLDRLLAGLEAFVATDYSTWEAILEQEQVHGWRTMLREVQEDTTRTRLIRDYTGMHSLLTDLDVTNQVDFDWGKSVVHLATAEASK